MPKVRYTGERTGNPDVVVRDPGPGLIRIGDEIDVTDAQAERFTTAHPTGDTDEAGKPILARDFVLVAPDPDETSRGELEDLARSAGLPTSGSRATLAARIDTAGVGFTPPGPQGPDLFGDGGAVTGATENVEGGNAGS